MKQKKGFTLIELLVVISIIGILASLALVSYTGAQKQTRDTQRRSDITQYRNGLEEYAATNDGLYPDDAGDAKSVCEASLKPNFMSDCPIDPLTGGTAYEYSLGTGNTGYILYTDLETAGYWFVCSTGKTGTSTSAPDFSSC